MIFGQHSLVIITNFSHCKTIDTITANFKNTTLLFKFGGQIDLHIFNTIFKNTYEYYQFLNYFFNKLPK